MPASSRTRKPGSPRAERPDRRRRRALRIIALLRERYPQVRLPLMHRDPFQLLVATILSAQRLEPWGRGEDRADGLGIVVDTHVRRVSQRLGLASTDDPEKIEEQLMSIIPRQESDSFSLRLIYFGREVCTAKRPNCLTCPMKRLCPSAPFLGNPPWMRRRRRAGRFP